MSNYNWLEFAGLPAALRYPLWVEGGERWRESAGSSDAALDALLDSLVAARATVRRGVPGTELSVPRLFISHRRTDEARAREVEALAQTEGFQVWLDVLNPVFPGLAQPGPAYRPTAREIAVFIEIALLNSTHVIALITRNTRGTMWVPYEYGRVKDSSAHSSQAACWIGDDVPDPPEYLELGVTTTTDAEIRTWLRQELARWASRYPAVTAPVPGATGRRALTAEQHAVIAGRFRNGVGEALRAPRKAKFKKS